MADESHTFGSTRARLEEIVTQVRKKDTSLEKSLDLLEEGVRLANACTELIDQQDWGIAPPTPASAPTPTPTTAPTPDARSEATAPSGGAPEASTADDAGDLTECAPSAATVPVSQDAGEDALGEMGLRDGVPDESFDAALSAWADEASEGEIDPSGTVDPDSDDSEAAQ